MQTRRAFISNYRMDDKLVLMVSLKTVVENNDTPPFSIPTCHEAICTKCPTKYVLVKTLSNGVPLYRQIAEGAGAHG
jgi:hypothetical protein